MPLQRLKTLREVDGVPKPQLLEVGDEPSATPGESQSEVHAFFEKGDLAKAAKRFAKQYSGCLRHKKDGSLEEGLFAKPKTDEPAIHLLQVVQYLRDMSWRSLMEAEHIDELGKIFDPVLPIIASILQIVARLQVRKALVGGASPTEVMQAALIGLQVSCIYCDLCSTCGAPAKVVVEEISVAVVQCLKQCIVQFVKPLLTPQDIVERVKKKEKTTSTQEALPYGPEHITKLCAAVSDVLFCLHEFVSRHNNNLADTQLHQIVHMTVGFYFFSEPQFRLCAAAEEMLVTIFSRHQGLLSSVLSDFLVLVPHLPSGKLARKFRLPVGEGNPDNGLTTWTHLLLRLVQCTCLPLREPLGREVDFGTVQKARAAAQTVLIQLTSGMIQRLLLTRTRDDELRAVLDEHIDELLGAAYKPMWPGALAMLRNYAVQFIGILMPEKKKEAAEVSIRDFALKLLGKITAYLCHHAVECAKSLVKLPAWSEATGSDQKDGRLLQHVALRISLDECQDMPWSEAAKAVQAWDAELYLDPKIDDSSGLSSFTDDIAFRYIILGHLEDSRTLSARCPPAAGEQVVLSHAIFPAQHIVHAWSFLVCDWAESVTRDSHDGNVEQDVDEEQQRQLVNIQRLLSVAWTSRTPLSGEGSTWRTGGGRRVLLPFTVYKIFRQVQSVTVDTLRNRAMMCIISMANSPLPSLRKTAMRALSDIVEADNDALASKIAEDTLELRLRDESSWVRHASLDLLGRVLGGIAEDEDPGAQPTVPRHGEQTSAAANALLLKFQEAVHGRINDVSVLVRRQASKILSAFVLNHPDHPDVVKVCLDLLRRSGDSDILRRLVLSTFELLWFQHEEPTSTAAHQLARVVHASCSMSSANMRGSCKFLVQMLTRLKENLKTRKRSKGYQYAIQRWTTLLLSEFVHLVSGDGAALAQQHGEDERWLQAQALLTTMEEFAFAEPTEMASHLRPLTVYLALDYNSTDRHKWIAVKVCRIISAVLPRTANTRHILDTASVHADLQSMIGRQASTGVYEAMRCLCSVVKYVSGDLSQILLHLNGGILGLMHLCERLEAKDTSASVTVKGKSKLGMTVSPTGVVEKLEAGEIRQAGLVQVGWRVLSVDGESYSKEAHQDKINSKLPYTLVFEVNAKDRKQADATQEVYMGRQIWTLSSIFESLQIDMFVKNGNCDSHRRVIEREWLKFELVDNSVALTVADLIFRLWDLNMPRLQAVLVSCLGLFLCGHRSFIKERRIVRIFELALCHFLPTMRLKSLEALSLLLSHFGKEADREIKNANHDLEAGRKSDASANKEHSNASATETAQPLAAFSTVVLDHITVGIKGEQHPGADKQLWLQIRVEALTVARLFHEQGLVNPMTVLPKVFALCFSGEARLAEPAAAMLKDMLEIRPTLLLNRMSEALHDAFMLMLASESAPRIGDALGYELTALSDVYADRFRKHKLQREGFIRKMLSELLRLDAPHFTEQFPELITSAVPAHQDKPQQQGPRLKRRRLLASGREAYLEDSKQEADDEPRLAGLDSLSPLQYHQVLYAQFVACSLSAMPFIFENEPLLVIYECNRYLSLHSGTVASGLDLRNSQPADGDAQIVASESVSERNPPPDTFSEAVSIVTCIVLKRAMREEFNLSAGQCAHFNPKELRQERLGRAGGVWKAAPAGTEEAAMCGTVRFRLDEFCRLLAPVISHAFEPKQLAAYIMSLAEEDPWDTTYARHMVVEKQEGGRGRKRNKAVPVPLNDDSGSDYDPREDRKKKQPAARAKASGRGQGRGPRQGRGRGRGRGAAKGRPVKSSKTIIVDDEPEDEVEGTDIDEDSGGDDDAMDLFDD